MDPISVFLDKVKIGRGQSHKNMTVFTLLTPDKGEPDYLTLEEAFDAEAIEIKEMHEGGSVPELKLINHGGMNVLILEAEELMGAKQNRVVNATFLVPGKSEIVLPVSCVEAGRWVYRTEKFRSGQKMMPLRMRRGHQQEVACSLRRAQGFRADQSRVWQDIEEKGSRMGVKSPTGAMADLFEEQEDTLDSYQKKFRTVDCQVGAVFAINNKVVGMDCYSFQDTFSKFFAKLIASYAMEAVDWYEGDPAGRITQDKPREFLEKVRKAPKESHPSLGLGTDFRFVNKSLAGAGLVHEETLLHLGGLCPG